MLDKPLTADKQALVNVILDFDEDNVNAKVQKLVKAGTDPLQIAEVARQG